MKNFSVIVAATAGSLGIGKNGKLPWSLRGDLVIFTYIYLFSFFKDLLFPG
jgi:dihydrofolate reductase